jgi:hypothetical protein
LQHENTSGICNFAAAVGNFTISIGDFPICYERNLRRRMMAMARVSEDATKETPGVGHGGGGRWWKAVLDTTIDDLAEPYQERPSNVSITKFSHI